MRRVVEEDPLIGSDIGGCLLEAEIGRGGMGVVFRARQHRLGRTVALKVIAPDLARDDAFRRRFERESRVAASIDHPNVVPLYEAGEDLGRLFLIMRYVEGPSLDQVIGEGGTLEPARAARIVLQVGSALDAAHRRGLVHRDVKPANVLLSGLETDEQGYLSDFGLTKDASSRSALTHTGQWVGTADYVAPEQLEGLRVDARTDVYALGCLLFEALTGAVPFPGQEVAKMWGHVNSPPPSPGAANEALAVFDAVVARGMAKDPDERFPSAGDLGRAADAAARGEPPTAGERSVATGAAAPGKIAAGGPGGATRPDDAPAPARGPATQPPSAVGGRMGLAVAAVISTALVAFASVAVALIVSRDKDPAMDTRTASEQPTRERRSRPRTRTVTAPAPTPAPSTTPSAPEAGSTGLRFSTPRDPGQTYRAAYCRVEGQADAALLCWTPNDGYTLALPPNGGGARARSEEAQNQGLAPSGYTELAFGGVNTGAGYTCTSRSSGLTCVNGEGYGFRLPRYRGLPSFFGP